MPIVTNPESAQIQTEILQQIAHLQDNLDEIRRHDERFQPLYEEIFDAIRRTDEPCKVTLSPELRMFLESSAVFSDGPIKTVFGLPIHSDYSLKNCFRVGSKMDKVSRTVGFLAPKED